MQPHPRYQVLEKIGSGSYATVYRGRDLELGRDVAIKQIHEQFLDQAGQLDRFWAEAQLLASLQHPNIVTIYDIVRERGWLIMELMQANLSRLAGKRPMDVASVKSTLAHCLRAMKFLHTHGIVHGDIKPGNLMIDRRKRIKVGDFGLARRVSDDEGSLLKGTTKYMAPELVSDEFGDVGPASDLYSLGFTAYELLCGENFESLFPGLSAFGRDKQIAWMMWHAAPDRKLPEINRVLDGLPDDLARTVQKLIAKPQSERYRSADEALSDLNVDIKLVKVGDDGEPERPSTVDPEKRRRMLIIGAFAASVLVSMLILFSDLIFGTRGPRGPQRLGGVVRSVDPSKNKVVLVDESGYPVDMEVHREARFYSIDDKIQLFLRDLKPGDRIEIPEKISSPPVYDLFRPKSTRGRLTQLDVPHNELQISVEEGATHERPTIRVPKTAKVTLNGKPYAFKDLQIDDVLILSHVPDSRNDASRVAITVDALRTEKMAGFVVTADEQRVVLETRSASGPTKAEFPVARDCRVVINGQTEADGRTYTVKDIKPGDRVLAMHDSHLTALDVSRRKQYTGVVSRVDDASQTVMLTPMRGDEAAFTLANDCEITLGGETIRISDLRRLDKVTATYDGEEGARTAYTLDAVRPVKPDRLAILIGVEGYEDRTITRLKNSRFDIRKIEERLLKRYSVSPQEILRLEDPTGRELQSRVSEWLKRTTNLTQVIVYFAGQGYRADDGTIILAARDTQFDKLAETGVRLRWLADQLDDSVARERILLLDASHNGAGADLKQQPSSAEMFETVKSKGGFKQTWGIASCGPGQSGLDWDAKGQGVFGWAVTEAYGGLADTDRNSTITPDELFNSLRKQMAEGSRAISIDQTPVMFAP